MNRKIRLINYPALAGTFLLIAACIAAYAVIGIFFGDEGVGIQILNTVIGFVLVFSVFDLWYLFRAGITVKDGIVETGKGPSGASDGFPVKELTGISLATPDGKAADETKLLHARVHVVFHLSDGRRKTYDGHMLTRGQYRRIRTLLAQKSAK